MSIGKEQAKLLATNFLDSLGSDKDGLQPKELLSEVYLIAAELVEDAQKNLINSKNIASGKLSESISIDDPTHSGTVMRLDIRMLYYGLFQNKGVRGTRGGRGLYQFKYENPSAKMVKAIADWINMAKRSVRTVSKYKPYGKHETRRTEISKIDSAYAFARGIKMGGIKPNNFMDKAIIGAQQKVRDRLSSALRIDIINALKIEE